MPKLNNNKKILLLCAMLAFALTVSSCKEKATEPTPPKIPDCITVESIAVDSVTAKQLNDVFETLSGLYSLDILEINEIYAINSLEDIDEYEEFGFSYFPDNIDFEQYTLIGGVLVISSISYEVLSDELCKNDSLKTYIRKFSIKQGDATAVRYHWYWNLYPKLDTNFQVILEKNVNKGETE